MAHIDTHSHVVPPFYAEWLHSQGLRAGRAADPFAATLFPRLAG